MATLVEPFSTSAWTPYEGSYFSRCDTLQQNLFSNNPIEDPNLYLSVFVQFDDTLKSNDVDPEAIWLGLFSLSLRDRAQSWLWSLPSNSITTWNKLKKAFLARYFSPSKTAQLRNQNTYFRQMDGGSLFEALEWYKKLTIAYPHHILEKWFIIHTIYNDLLYNTRMTIDSTTSGTLTNKTFNIAYISDREYGLEPISMGEWTYSCKNVAIKMVEQFSVDSETLSLSQIQLSKNFKLDIYYTILVYNWWPSSSYFHIEHIR